MKNNLNYDITENLNKIVDQEKIEQEVKEQLKSNVKKIALIIFLLFFICTLLYIFKPSVNKDTFNTFENKGFYKVENLNVECTVLDKTTTYVKRWRSFTEIPKYYLALYTTDDGGTKHKEAYLQQEITLDQYDSIDIGDTIILTTKVYYSPFRARLFRNKIKITEIKKG